MLDLPNGFRFPRVGIVAWELTVADESKDETDELVESSAVGLRKPAY
jgi:hypothetical protein